MGNRIPSNNLRNAAFRFISKLAAFGVCKYDAPSTEVFAKHAILGFQVSVDVDCLVLLCHHRALKRPLYGRDRVFEQYDTGG